MRVYKFKCECGNEFKGIYEKDAEIKCSKCGSSKLEKSIDSSIMPGSDILGDLRNVDYLACKGCTTQNCDTCEKIQNENKT